MLSLTSEYVLVEMFTNSRSGSFFFYSADYRFILKTCTKREAAFLMAALPQYHAHLMQVRTPARVVRRSSARAWISHGTMYTGRCVGGDGTLPPSHFNDPFASRQRLPRNFPPRPNANLMSV